MVGVRDILAQAVSRPTFVKWGSAHGAGYCWILDYLSISIVFYYIILAKLAISFQ